MMNFLDLSAASEEERRLITELLSDTSVVNFAEPLCQQYPSHLDQELQQHQTRNNQQPNRSHYSQHSHPQSQPVKVKLQNQQQQLNQQQQNYDVTSNAHPNHVNNQNVLRNEDNQYHVHQVPPLVGSTAKLPNNATPSTPYSSNLSAQNAATTTSNTSSNNIDSNNIGVHLNSRVINTYTINDNANNGNIKSHNYPIISQDNISSSTSPLLAKTTTTIHTSLANNATFATSNVTQSTSTVPPQTVANQMSPLMAGDINSVINMDMASSQPPSYPMAMPQPPQISAYGPAPPPHHVYGGPPIFQPYTTHYLVPYNLPYPMSYVLPPTNSVVQARQQLAPQSNQQPPPLMSNNSHSRPHAHHARSNKLKEVPKQQHQHHNHHNHHNHHQQHMHQHQHQHQLHQSIHQQHGYRPAANLDSHVNHMNEISGQQMDSYDNYTKSNHFEMHRSEVNMEEQKPVNDAELHQQPNPQAQKQDHETLQEAMQIQEPAQNIIADTDVRIRKDEEIIKISSDEGFDAQSSLDLSKQSHESSNTNAGEIRPKPKKEACDEATTNKSDLVVSETNTEEKSLLNQETKSNGPWASAASKSWASLFRADGSSHHGPPMNGDIAPENLTDPDNSEEETRGKSRIVSKQEAMAIGSNHLATTKEQRSQDAARRAQDKMAPKLGQKINSISLKHSLPLLRPRGFINKGNGCYINSTLQALIACPPFYNLMKEIGELRGLKRDSSCTPILDSFAELFQNFPPLDASKKSKQVVPFESKLPMNYLQAEAIEPRCIYNVLGQIKSECLRGAQEDAEEFLSSVLNGLHEEIIGLSETLQLSQDNSNHLNGHLSDNDDIAGDINNDENLWREVGPKNRSLPIRAATVINTPIQEIFGGSLFSIRTAGKDRCGHRSPFFDLQLDISGDNVKSLQDAIKSFTATEIIQDFYCSKTKQKLDAQRRTSLDQLPPILILHLKQFIYTPDHGLKKLMKRIEYPIDFELPESCLHDKNSDKSLKNSRSYKLLAVVYHEGKEAVKGHYLTDVYHIGSSQWIRCDDSNLKVVPAPRIENQESSRTPYLLFYRRLNTLGPRQSSSHDSKKKN